MTLGRAAGLLPSRQGRRKCVNSAMRRLADVGRRNHDRLFCDGSLRSMRLSGSRGVDFF